MKFGLILFTVCVVLQPVAQILEKYGMKQVGEITSWGQLFSYHTLWKVITNPYIVCGVVLAAALLVLWLGALSTLDASYIYPFGSVAYIILALLAVVFLKESITATHWVGMVVIVCGCYLINQ